MTKANYEQNEQLKRIRVPEGKFCGACPHLSGNYCSKASAQLTSDRIESLCADRDMDMYFMCKVYDPAGGRF